MESILDSIKKLLGIESEYEAFDTDIIIHINSVFMVLNQLGVGPEVPFVIHGKDEQWESFDPRIDLVEAVKSYMYLKIRLLFDPPTSGVLHEAMERQIGELEWRLNIQAEGGNQDESK